MEGCQGKGQALINRHIINIHMEDIITDIIYCPDHSIDEPIENHQNPQHAEDIKEHVCQGCATCLRIGRKGSQIRSNGRTDILTQHQSDTH